MRMSRFSLWAAVVILAVGMTAAVAHADGTDPQGKFQNPNNGGTPGVDNEFSLPAFGSSGPGCTWNVGGDQTEDCVLKNQSNTNWTWVNITVGADVACGSIMFTTDLFSNPVSCTNNADNTTTILLTGVNYSPQNTALFTTANTALSACNPVGNPNCTITNIQTELVESPLFSGNCVPGNGYFPGVLIGCDFEIELGPGADGGNWPIGASINVVAPEPPAIALLLIGLAGLPFAVRRHKSLSV
jgi:hypothetical protein